MRSLSEMSLSGPPLSGRPLSGKRILVTRPRAQAASLGDKLAGLGAEPILFPTIEIGQMEDHAPLDDAIRALPGYDWIIFTSANGVAAFWKRLDLSGLKDLTGLGDVFIKINLRN